MHKKLLERALEAIREVFSDTSVPLEETLASLRILQEEIGLAIEAVQSDIRSQEG